MIQVAELHTERGETRVSTITRKITRVGAPKRVERIGRQNGDLEVCTYPITLHPEALRKGVGSSACARKFLKTPIASGPMVFHQKSRHDKPPSSLAILRKSSLKRSSRSITNCSDDRNVWNGASICASSRPRDEGDALAVKVEIGLCLLASSFCSSVRKSSSRWTSSSRIFCSASR